MEKLGQSHLIDSKEQEDLNSYQALLSELTDLVNAEGETHSPEEKEGEIEVPKATEEDRIDDPDDEPNVVKQYLKFLTEKASFSFGKDDDKMETDMSIEYISDYGKLEVIE